MPERDWSDIEQRLSQVENLPTLPTIIFKTMRIILDPGSSVNDLHVLLRNDPALTATIMQLANSAYYGFRHKIESLKTALVMLGMKEVARMVTTFSILHNFPLQQLSDRFNFERFWRHSASVGEVAQGLATETGVRLENEVFTPGLLHDIGKLILAAYFESDFLRCIIYAEENEASFTEAELEILGADHMKIGASIVQRWGLSDHFHEVILHHHAPMEAEKYRLETALIYLAGRICKYHGVDFGSMNYEVNLLEDPVWEILHEHNAQRPEKVGSENLVEEMGLYIQNTQILTELAIG